MWNGTYPKHFDKKNPQVCGPCGKNVRKSNTKAVFYSELVQGQRPTGRPKKRYKDPSEGHLKRCNIPPNDFEMK